jgi:hypothetical protein
MSRPLDDALAPPWVLRRSSPVLGGEADSRRSLRSTRLPTVSPADLHSELGPRSLDPDRPFWSAYAELIRGQTSPADFCNETTTCEQNQPGLSILAGREASTSFLFSEVPRPLPCGSGDTRRAALRPPVQPQCWFLPLARVCPTVMPERSPHHGDAFGASCVVRIDAHGSKDRAKDASAERRHDLSCMRRVHTLCAHARRRSPPRRPPDIRCHRRAIRRGRKPTTTWRTDRDPRSDGAPRREPPSRRPGCLLPSRHARESSRRDCSLRPSRRLSRSRRPHLAPRGQLLLMGIARSRRGHPQIREHREYRRLFDSVDSSRLGLTTQARHRARPTRPSTRTDCPARTDAGRSA